MQDLDYKSFNSLMASVEGSLEKFVDNNLIKRSKYIKVARFVNSDLGIKINRVKEEVIDIEHYRAEMPSDLLSIITAFVVFDEECKYPEDIIHHWQNTRQNCHLLKPISTSLSWFSKYSINKYCKINEYQIDVSERQMSFNFKTGKLYIAYTADMVNEKGELMVLDHPLVNPYYESAITAQILKDLWYNIDADTQIKYQNELQVVLPEAKKKAIGIITFPGYRKLKEYSNKVEQEYYNQWVAKFV